MTYWPVEARLLRLSHVVKTGSATAAGLLLLVAGLTLLVYPTLAKATADTSGNPYTCLNPRAPSSGGPWLSASSGHYWENPTDPLQAQPSTQESQIAADFATSIGNGFSPSWVKDYANTQCDTFWNIEYADSTSSTVQLLVFQTDQVVNYGAVVNTFGMNATTGPDGTQYASQDTEGYLDYGVTATTDGLITVVLSEGANTSGLVSGWPTTTTTPTTVPCGPTTTAPCITEAQPYPEPLTVDQVAALSQTISTEILNTVSDVSTTTSLPVGSSTTIPPTVPSTVPATTSTTVPSADAQIAAAYNTFFDFANPSVADKVAVVQNGAALQQAIQVAVSSSLAQAATGASVNSIALPDSATCSQDGLSYPCASLQYDILGQGSQVLLSGQVGYAVSQDGNWLVAEVSACDLLGLFYNAMGLSGAAPGCPGSESTSTTMTTPTSSTSSTSSTMSPSSTTSTSSTAPASTTSSTPQAGSTSSSTSTPAQALAPAGGEGGTVTAPSGSLAFTGSGPAMRMFAALGTGLTLLGLFLLAVTRWGRRAIRRLGLHRPSPGGA